MGLNADPGFDITLDLTTAKKEEDEKSFLPYGTFYCSHIYHKNVNYFIFKQEKKNIWTNLQRILVLFTKKPVTKLSKIWVWYPESEIRDQEKIYSGFRGQKGTRSRIHNTA